MAIGDSAYLLFMLFVMVCTNLFLMLLDSDICPEISEKNYNFTTSFNASSEELYEDVKSAKCTGMPNWFYVLFNVPMLVVTGLVIKKYMLV